MSSTSYLKSAPLKDKMPESWDVEAFHEEADLFQNLIACQKHPDHKEFIPVDTFDITHLPTDYQDKDIVEYIKLVAQLTVRLTVRYVSPDRPATVPGTDTPYPFYENRGKNVMRVGTGVITNIAYGIDILWVTITTATHVVFDDQELENTTCDLFYDNGSQPSGCQAAVELEFNHKTVSGNPITDECVVNAIFKSKQNMSYLAHKLKSILLKVLKLRKNIKDRLEKISASRQEKPLTFIVSHPHGCSKTISFGRCVEVDDNLDDVRFLYTTPTCPGTSGAAVICLDKDAWNFNSVHCGTWKNSLDLNFGSGSYCPSYVTLLHGWYSQLWYRPDLRLTDRCPDLSSPLPPEYSYNLVVDYILTWTRLCVDVSVKYVSEQRPEFWPGTVLPYPCYNQRGSREERRGGGLVDRVDIYPNQSRPDKVCDCDTCRKSLTPARKFANIYITTSTSLVFDQTEERRTECGFCVLSLDELSCTQPLRSNFETDKSQLVFVTHDMILAEKCNFFLKHVSFLKEKIQEKLYQQLSDNPISIKISRYKGVTSGRCVRLDKHLVYPNEAEQEEVGALDIVLEKKHLNFDVR